MRVFLAIFPPREVQRAAAALIESLRRPSDGVSWVREENLHFTLRFLGEIGEDGLRRASEAARETAAASAPFDIALGAAGAFPDAKRPRVIWLGLSEGVAPLETLARDLDRALARRGFERSGQRFSAHLTLGRVRRAERDWSAALEAANLLEKSAAARFTVRSIDVVVSTLSPRGSQYAVHAEAHLGA